MCCGEQYSFIGQKIWKDVLFNPWGDYGRKETETHGVAMNTKNVWMSEPRTCPKFMVYMLHPNQSELIVKYLPEIDLDIFSIDKGCCCHTLLLQPTEL